MIDADQTSRRVIEMLPKSASSGALAETPARSLSLSVATKKWVSWRRLRHLELYGVEPETIDGPAPELVGAINAGVIISTADASSGEIELDPSSFVAWLLRQGIMPCVAPRAAATLDPTMRDVHPATAVAWIAFGEVWSPERVAAFDALTDRLRNILYDHAAGVVVLDAKAFGLALALEARAFVFLDARDKLEAAVRIGAVEAYSANEGRVLHAADFANPLWLDVLNGKYVANTWTMVLTEDWERATAAARRIGPVRLSARDVIALRRRPSASARQRKHAAEVLRTLFEVWRRGDAPMPVRADWEEGLGREIAGSRNAARVVWAEVTRDPAYAAARARGRRAGRRNGGK